MDHASDAREADTTLRPHPDVVARRLNGGGVLVHLATNEAFELNDTAILIWELLDKQVSARAILRQLVAEFDVEEARASQELSAFLEQCQQRGLFS